MRPNRQRRFKVQRIRIASEAQWHAARAQDVTASTIAALFGLSPYQSLLDLWLEKKRGHAVAFDSPLMERGRRYERVVAEFYQERHPQVKLRKARDYYRAPLLRIGGTPDYLAKVPGSKRLVPLECKVVNVQAFKRHWTEDTIPVWISLQTLTQAMLLNAPHGIVAALVDDGFRVELHEYEVPRHKEAEARLKDGVARFWDSLARDEMPKFDFAVDRALIGVIFPTAWSGSVLDLRGDNELPIRLAERDALKEKIDALIDRQRAIETMLMAKMGNNEAALVEGYKISFKNQHRKAYSVDASDFRVLRITHEQEPKR
jgi:predicted phage-related endonuclease